MDKYFLCNQLEEGISIDSLIQNGDTSAILVSGRRELLQRVWIQLTAHRGEFPYCGTLGSRLYQIAASDSKCEQKVLEAIEEALEFIPQVRVKDVVILVVFSVLLNYVGTCWNRVRLSITLHLREKIFQRRKINWL